MLYAQTDYTIGTKNKDGFTTINKSIQLSAGGLYTNPKYETRYGLIEEATKKILLSTSYRLVYTSYEPGIYIIKDTLDRYDLYDAKNKTFITQEKYNELSAFYDGLATVSKKKPDSYEYISGVIDKTGKLVIPMEYQYVGLIYEGLINVQKDNKFGFINIKNEMVIPAIYNDASAFGDGLAPVALEEGKHGYINKENVFVIAPQYVDADNFRDGYAVVYKSKGGSKIGGRKMDDERGVINTEGKMIVEPLYGYIDIRNKGKFFIVSKNDKYGLLDNTGKAILPLEYKKINEFNEKGYAVVEKSDGTKGLINTSGSFLINPEYNELYYNYYNPEILIAKKQGKYSLLDENLKVLLLSDSAKDMRSFKNLFAIVFDDKVKVYDLKGKLIKTIPQSNTNAYGITLIGGDNPDSMVIPYNSMIQVIDLVTNTKTQVPGYDLSDFNEEGIFVTKDGTYQFYDHTGKKLSEKKYENIVNFSEGIVGLQDYSYTTPYLANKNFTKISDLSYVFYGPYSEGLGMAKGQYDGKVYYLDKTGRTVFGIYAKEGYPCKNGKILILDNSSKYFYVDREGKKLTDDTYDVLGEFNSGLAGYKNGNKFGYIDTLGNKVITGAYVAITGFSNGAALVQEGNNTKLINTKGVVISTENFEGGDTGIEGSFPVKKASGWGLINNKGVKVIDFVYEAIQPKINGMIWAKKNGKWGVLNATGVAVTEFEYESLENFNNGFAKIEKDKKLGLINKAGKVVLPFIYNKMSSVYQNKVITYLPSGKITVSLK